MSFVSKREPELEAFEAGRAAIPQAPLHPIPLVRLQRPLDWRHHYAWQERKPSWAVRRRVQLHERRKERVAQLARRLKLVGNHEGMRKRLADLSRRLKFAGNRIMFIGERIRLAQEHGEQLERERIERMRTPLGRLSERLKSPEAQARIQARARSVITGEFVVERGLKLVTVAPFGRLFAGGCSTKPRICRLPCPPRHAR